MPLPICTKCKREMTVKENGVPVKDKEAGGFPATFWYGDLFICPGCGIEMIYGFGRGNTEPRSQADADRAIEFSRGYL